MSTPDFSQDRELVECAKAMHFECRPDVSWDEDHQFHKDRFLRMADAARTFFGSGYRLPEATEENAERMAKARWDEFRKRSVAKSWDEQTPVNKQTQESKALDYLRAMHAAFGEQERQPKAYPPGPTPCGHAQFIPPSSPPPEYVPTDAEERYVLGKWDTTLRGLADGAKIQPPRDISGDAERRKEREQMVLQFLVARAAANDTGTSFDQEINYATSWAETYLEWRRRVREEACKP